MEIPVFYSIFMVLVQSQVVLLPICASVYLSCQYETPSLIVFCTSRKDGQDTQDELQKRNLREELEDRERRHFSSKDKSYNGKKREEMNIIQFLLACNFLVLICWMYLIHVLCLQCTLLAFFFIYCKLNCMLLQMKEVAGRKAISYWKVNVPACLMCISI